MYIYTSFQLAVDIIEVAKTCIVYNTQESLHHNNIMLFVLNSYFCLKQRYWVAVANVLHYRNEVLITCNGSKQRD